MTERLTDTEETFVLEINKIDERIKLLEDSVKSSRKAVLPLIALTLGSFYIFILFYNTIPVMAASLIIFIFSLFVLFLAGASAVKDDDAVDALKKEKETLINKLAIIGVNYDATTGELELTPVIKNEKIPEQAEKIESPQPPVKITLSNDEEEGFFD